MLWSFILEGVGLVGAFLVGFCFAGLVYAPVYLRNLYSWRKSDKGKL